MSTFGPVLEVDRHYYPFLGEYAFDRSSGILDQKVLQRLIGEYAARHIRKNATKKGGGANEVLDSLVEQITKSCDRDVIGTGSNLLAIVDKLSQGDDVGLYIGLTNVTLHLKRFGVCVGVRATDAGDNTHKDATEILEKMASLSTEEGGFNYFMQFVCSQSVITPRWQAYGNNNIDIAAELASAARYVPDVSWRTDAAVVAEALREDYIVTDHQYGCYGGVEVGQYHDIPVYAQILFGRKSSDRTWRKGSVTCGGTVLLFDSNSSDSPHIRYMVRTADGNNVFRNAKSEIDYEREQSCQTRLAKVLLDAFSARDLAETIKNNPHHVAWKKKVVAQTP